MENPTTENIEKPFGQIATLVSQRSTPLVPKLSQTLCQLNCSIELIEHREVPWETLSADHAPPILLVEWEPDCRELSSFLEELWSLNQEFPYFLFLIGELSEREKLLTYLNNGAHEILTLPLDVPLLERKLQIAAQVVGDRRSLREILGVMERYARHADQIAAEKTRQLIHAERLSTLGTLSAGLAHEIGNPLGFMTTSLETAKIYWEQISKHQTEESKEQDSQFSKACDRLPKALERINIGLEKVNKLMLSLRKFARSSQGEHAPFSIALCVENSLEICQAATMGMITIENELSSNLPFVQIDHNQVEQVLMNLIVNASHALENQDQPTLRFYANEDDEFLTVHIEDNGPGIPRSKLETIWKPYYTSKAEGKGTGLGLAISKSLIRDNGGTITAENVGGGGARFSIRLPKSEPDVSEPSSDNKKNSDS